MKTDYETLLVERPREHLVQVTLNRPAVANSLNTRMGHELTEVFTAFEVDPSLARAVVLTGAGERIFCAGADLRERRGMSDQDWLKQHRVFERMMRAIIDCPIPVIAAVNGAAYAGGCELTLACDFAYASKTARFALTEVTIGIMPGGAGTQTLPRIVGERRAKEIILGGEPISAADALAWGIVNRLCEPATLLQETLDRAQRIAENAPISVRQAKHSIHHGLQMDLRSGMMLEIEAYNRMVPTEDRREGVAAFNEKRKPRFKGR